jgi:hypothetical protein
MVKKVWRGANRTLESLEKPLLDYCLSKIASISTTCSILRLIRIVVVFG